MKVVVAFIIALFMAPHAHAQKAEPVRGMAQDAAYCEANPEAIHCLAECDGSPPKWATWCGDEVFDAFGREPTESDVRGADLLVRDAWIYRKDFRDVWKSFEVEVASGEKFRGDCEDIVLTIQAFLIAEGIHPDSIGRAIVHPPKEDVLDHMVGIANIGGVIWLYGDTYGPARPLAETGYRVKWFQWASNGLAWKVGSI
jgi:hypothetical protein